YDLKARTGPRVVKQYKGPTGTLLDVAVSSDGSRVAAAVHEKPVGGASVIKVWDGLKGTVLHTIYRGGLSQRALTLSGDGKTLLAGGVDGSVSQFDLAKVPAKEKEPAKGLDLPKGKAPPKGKVPPKGKATDLTFPLKDGFRGHQGNVVGVDW